MKFAIKKIFNITFLNNEANRELWVKKILETCPSGQSILDAGAGECRYKKYCKHLKYTSQDFGQYNGIGDDVGLQTGTWNTSDIDIVCDVESLPFNDGSFDNILCTEVLEHVPHPDKTIKELARVLKKDGKLILTAPFCSQTHFAPFHFYTGFNIYWYKKILAENGLHIISFTTNGNYFDYVCQELFRTPFMIKKYSRFSYASYLLYIIILPAIFFITIISKLTKKSEQSICFGYHVVANKW